MTDDISNKIDEFFSQYTVRKYSKGQVLLLAGDSVPYVYYLVQGTVKMYDVSYKGDELILNLFKPPAFFPMSHAINKNPNLYIYEAETDVELRQAPADKVVSFLKSDADVTYDLLSRVYRGVDGLIGRTAKLMASNAKDRLLYELLTEARRFGKVMEDGSCVLEIGEKQLGSRAGLSRETVSRELSKLRAEKILKAEAKHIIISDLDALQKKLGN